MRAQPAAGSKDTPGGSALNRIERLIDALIAHPDGLPATSRELSQLVGAVGPTAERLRATALLTGLAVAPHPDRLYPGPLLLKWAAILGPHLDISEIVRPEIEALAAEVGETIGYVNYNPATGTAVMETVAWGNTPLKYGLATGVEIPLYAGAAGKAILAFAPPEIVDQQVLVPLNPNTITNLDELRAATRADPRKRLGHRRWRTNPRRLRRRSTHLHQRQRHRISHHLHPQLPIPRDRPAPAQHRTHPHHQQNQPTTQRHRRLGCVRPSV